jgi:dihydrofolate synthase/folylpolyglutamate synthase
MARLDETLARLKVLHPLSIDLSLGRIERLLGELGHPERRLPPVIHVAGTNGKGSVSAFLKAMIEAAGKRTHLYTSPHLVRFGERIQIAGPAGQPGAPIGDDALIALLERVEKVNGGAPITFFEITTAAALLAFAECPADAVVLEVGLGGRLDTTNVVPPPLVSVITPVALDHVERLGPTIAHIAAEKAGILKRGTVCVTARQTPEAEAVIEERARALGVRLVRAGQEFDAFRQGGRLVYQQENQLLDLPLPALVGRHQIGNAGVAIAAALEAKALGVDEAAIARGLVEVRWPARMQRLASGPLVERAGADAELWLDGAHNPAGGLALAETLADLDERSPRPVWLVVGMMGQKDATRFLTAFRGIVEQVVTVPIPGAHETPAKPEQIAALARNQGLRAETAPSVELALDRIRSLRKGPARIVICGSLYLAGHVLALQDGVAVQTN